MTEEPEQDFKIIKALAAIKDVGDFRLRQVMADLGLNPSQPIVFYRELIREAREIMDLIDILERNIDTDTRVIAKQKATLSARDEQVKTLTAKLHRLEEDAHRKTDNLKKERNGLETTALQRQEKAEIYDGVKELLKGGQDTKVVGALYRLFSDLYTEMQYADLGMKPPPDLAPLAYIRQKLREQLMEALSIPKDILEKENARLKEQIDALVTLIRQQYKGGG